MGNIGVNINEYGQEYIEAQSLERMFKLMNKHVINFPSLKLLIKERREILRQGNIEEYKSLAFEVADREMSIT